MNKEMISTMRTVTVEKISDVITDQTMVMAMTINDELNSLGYTLKPAGIVKLAKSNMTSVVDDFKKAIGNINAKPMYPNFPTQVMEMNVAEYRFHQLFHYFSTYGMETLFGTEVKRGWLPSVEDTEKVKDDTTLLSLKVLDVIFEEEISDFVINKLSSKNERFTIEEMMLFESAVSMATHDTIVSMNVEFKENLIPIFNLIFKSNRDDKKEILVGICQHTGDVWKCIEALLAEYKHFKTSQKNLLVSVLESFPITDFEANLILSNSKATNVKRMLKYLDYNMYSKSSEHKLAVAKLRNNELRSWEGQAKALISERNNDAVKFIAARPGMLIRMISILLRAGYSVTEISEELEKHASELSTQTLVSLLSHFGRENTTNFNGELHDVKEASDIFEIVNRAFVKNLKSKNTELKDKKVYFDLDAFDLDLSQLECNNKSPESGYLVSGLAIKIPENVNKMRFFVYWNDESRVDIDLHTYGLTANDEFIHIGWNAYFCNGGMITSGDITHSDAAEFIDIDLNVDMKRVKTEVDIYNIYKDCKKSMKNIDTVFVGMMAVDKIGEDVKLYQPKNCFFSHFLKGDEEKLTYGIIDIPHRVLIFKGSERDINLNESLENQFNLRVYLNKLMNSQNAVIVDKKEDADFVLSMEKTKDENGISLIDKNFYLD